jgi:hypothetical protein
MTRLLAVVLPSVLDLYRDTGKDQRRVCEIQSTFGQRFGALDRIERDSRTGYCIYNN